MFHRGGSTTNQRGYLGIYTNRSYRSYKSYKSYTINTTGTIDPIDPIDTTDTLWLFNIAIENGPFIDDFPIKTSIYGGFSMAMLNNQMVYIIGVSKGGVLTLIPAVCPTDTASRFLCEIKAPSLSARVASRH